LICVSASVALHSESSQIIQNVAVGDGIWVLVIKIQEGAEGLKVEQLNLDLSTHTPHPRVPGHDVLKLWRMRERVEKSRYFKVVVPDFGKNKSWGMVLKQGVLGPVVDLAAAEDPEVRTEDREAANAFLPAHIRPEASPEPAVLVDLLKDELEEEKEKVAMDPFKCIWEYATDMAKPWDDVGKQVEEIGDGRGEVYCCLHGGP
jgi:hypothetical protein